MTDALTITIPGRPPTPNYRYGNVFAQRNTEKKWKRVAFDAAKSAMPADWTPLHRARLSIEFVVPDRRERDEDNLIASTKCLTDGLVEAGVLVGDSTRVIVDRQHSTRYVRGVAATIYIIEPVAAPEGTLAL